MTCPTCGVEFLGDEESVKKRTSCGSCGWKKGDEDTDGHAVRTAPLTSSFQPLILSRDKKENV